MSNWGDFIKNFETRTCGKATLTLRFLLAVKIFELLSFALISSCADPQEQMIPKVFFKQSFLVREKHRVVCAVLSSGHFDIGVVHENGSSRAVFDLGSHWDCAFELILSFIKGRSPESMSAKRERLIPQWIENAEQADGCACGETSCDCR